MAEAFHDILAFNAPTISKGPGANVDQIFVVEMMGRLGNSLAKFLAGTTNDCTTSEKLYYQTIGLLANLLSACVGMDQALPVMSMLGEITDAVKMAQDTICDTLVTLDANTGIAATVSKLRRLHDMTMLHDTATATKLTTSWILRYNESQREHDRSGSGNLPKDVVILVKSLQAAAEAALAEGKSLATGLNGEVAVDAEYTAEFKRWVFEKGGEELSDLIGNGEVETLLNSWRSNIKGWQHIKW